MAFDTYMMVDDGSVVKGESTATGEGAGVGSFDVYSFSWGASNPVTVGSAAGGLGAGKVSISSFNIMKKSENSSAVIFNSVCTGQHYAKIVISMRKAAGSDAGQTPFLVYTFTDCMFESIQWSGSSGGDDSPTESISIAFGQVAISYSEQKANDGSITQGSTATWDLTKVAKK